MIERSPKRKAEMSPSQKYSSENIDTPAFGSLTAAAPKMTGAESMNENFAASSLRSPDRSPALIVIPDRDVPGIRAMA